MVRSPFSVHPEGCVAYLTRVSVHWKSWFNRTLNKRPPIGGPFVARPVLQSVLRFILSILLLLCDILYKSTRCSMRVGSTTYCFQSYKAKENYPKLHLALGWFAASLFVASLLRGKKTLVFKAFANPVGFLPVEFASLLNPILCVVSLFRELREAPWGNRREDYCLHYIGHRLSRRVPLADIW